MTVSCDAENGLRKIQHPFTMKTLRKPELEGNFLNLIKNIYSISTANITLND